MVTINELRNKKVTITMEPIVFNLEEDIGEDLLEEIVGQEIEDETDRKRQLTAEQLLAGRKHFGKIPK